MQAPTFHREAFPIVHQRRSPQPGRHPRTPEPGNRIGRRIQRLLIDPIRATASLALTFAILSTGLLADSAGAQLTYLGCMNRYDGTTHTYFLTNDALNCQSARSIASSSGGSLVTINDYDENELLRTSLLSVTTEGVWIGLTDQESEGTFRWISNEPFDYANWLRGEPSNTPPDEDAVAFYPALNGWNDEPVSNLHRAVIEFGANLHAGITAAAGPSNGTFTVIVPGSNITLDAASATAPAFYRYHWLRNGSALSDGISGSGSVLSGVTTSRLSISNASIADNGAYECEAALICAVVVSNPVFLSQSPLVRLGCFRGYGGTHTYFMSNEPLNWRSARSIASSAGGSLVSVNDASENEWLRTSLLSVTTEGVWIGLTDEVSEGVFRWLSNEPFSYSNWLRGEPNNRGDTGNEDWVAFYPAQNGWNDETFSNLHRTVIEINYPPPRAGITTSAGPNDGTFTRIVPGSSITLDAVSTTASTFQWRKNGVSVSNGASRTGSVLSGATTSRLSISNASLADSGVYECVVGDSQCGPLVSNSVFLSQAEITSGALGGAGFPNLVVRPPTQVGGRGGGGSGSTGGGLATATATVQMLPDGGGGTTLSIVGEAPTTASNSDGYTAVGTVSPIVFSLPSAHHFRVVNSSSGRAGALSVAPTVTIVPATLYQVSGSISGDARQEGTLSAGSYGVRFGVAAVAQIFYRGMLAGTPFQEWYGSFEETGLYGTTVNWRLELVPEAPRCPADLNQDGALDPDDLADFIVGYFSRPPGGASDFNGDGNVDPDDLSDYITAFFAGCG